MKAVKSILATRRRSLARFAGFPAMAVNHPIVRIGEQRG
jgi:hypothetical protein